MTKKISRILFLLFCFIIFISYSAIAGIQYSKHDFSSGTMFGPYQVGPAGQEVMVTEICVFCHTPHGASTATQYQDGSGKNQYLWNRRVPVGVSYTLYTSATLTRITLDNPTGLSLMCLSCHDGVTSIAVNSVSGSSQSLLNTPGSSGPTTNPMSVLTSGQQDYMGVMIPQNIGDLIAAGTGNLSNDHPVSFAWVNTISGINDPDGSGNFGTTGMKLYSGRMECSTCHNVHDNTTYPPFLKMSNEYSAMCLTCHAK